MWESALLAPVYGQTVFGDEIDINWWGIRVMQFLGLARAIKLVSLTQRFLA
jgi:fatty-acid desaturase